jgi:hypothetical protein
VAQNYIQYMALVFALFSPRGFTKQNVFLGPVGRYINNRTHRLESLWSDKRVGPKPLRNIYTKNHLLIDGYFSRYSDSDYEMKTKASRFDTLQVQGSFLFS